MLCLGGAHGARPAKLLRDEPMAKRLLCLPSSVLSLLIYYPQPHERSCRETPVSHQSFARCRRARGVRRLHLYAASPAGGHPRRRATPARAPAGETRGRTGHARRGEGVRRHGRKRGNRFLAPDLGPHARRVRRAARRVRRRGRARRADPPSRRGVPCRPPRADARRDRRPRGRRARGGHGPRAARRAGRPRRLGEARLRQRPLRVCPRQLRLLLERRRLPRARPGTTPSACGRPETSRAVACSAST